MEFKLKGWITYFAILMGVAGYAQDRYMVFFTDKDGTPYSLNQPEDFLSQESIDRRAHHGVAVTIADLPVNPDYVSQVKAIGVETYYTSRWMNGIMIQADAAQVDQVEALSIVQTVEWIGPGAPLTGGRVANSDKYEDLEDEETAVQNNLIGTTEMFGEGWRGDGVRIAILDAGFPGVNNIDGFTALRDQQGIEETWNFVGNESDVFLGNTHGTYVLSLLAGEIVDTFQGISTEATYLLYLTEDVGSEHRVEEYNFLFATERADSAGADIIMASLGYAQFDSPSPSYSTSDLDGNTGIATLAANRAAERGILFITSAGNSGGNSWQKVTMPGDCIDCLAVGSVTAQGLRSNFSSLGPTADGRIKPDVMAMGSAVKLLNSQNQIVTKNGTSLSAPQIAGLAAGLWERYPELKATELLNALRMSSDRSFSPDNFYGYGIPHYYGVVNYLETNSQTEDIRIFPNPVDQATLYFKVKDPFDINSVNYSLVNMNGQQVSEGEINFTWANFEQSLDLGDLNNGLYILRVQYGEELLTRRLVVR